MSELQLSPSDEFVIADALQRRYGSDSRQRGLFEQFIARGEAGAETLESAAFYEKRLADVDALLAKLPNWITRAVAR